LAATPTWRRLKPALAATVGEAALAGLSEQIENYDLPNALLSLRRLLQTHPAGPATAINPPSLPPPESERTAYDLHDLERQLPDRHRSDRPAT
ncbi:hypothetical protein, partial [Methylomonas koyamae]|uniref:hypothetical protein n=1 Tax=Methylomonas koyamae TaxID=702114 RepID=UPI00210FE68A